MAPRDAALRDGDEVALAAAGDRRLARVPVRITAEDFDAGARDRRAARQRPARRRGRVLHRHRARRQRRGAASSTMTLEHYPGMTEKALAGDRRRGARALRHPRCARHPSRRRAAPDRPDRARRRHQRASRRRVRRVPLHHGLPEDARAVLEEASRRRRARAGSTRARATTKPRRAGKSSVTAAALVAIDWGTTSARAYRIDARRATCSTCAARRSASLQVADGALRRGARHAARRLARRARAAARVRHDRQPPGLGRGAVHRDARRRSRTSPPASCARPARELAIVPGVRTRDAARHARRHARRGDADPRRRRPSARRACCSCCPARTANGRCVEQGRIVDFMTFMTGEMWHVLLDTASSAGSPRHRRQARAADRRSRAASRAASAPGSLAARRVRRAHARADGRARAATASPTGCRACMIGARECATRARGRTGTATMARACA